MQLPRPHFSPSQLYLWESNPREYERVYMMGGETEDSEQMRYGRVVDKAIENEEAGDEMMRHLLVYLPKYPQKQLTITAEVRVDKEPVLLLARPDGVDPAIPRIGDYKTGRVPWTQKRADQSAQLTFDALIWWLNTKKVPELAIHWMPTEWRGDRIECTGEVVTIETERSLKDLLAFNARVNKAVREIAARYEEITSKIFS